MSVPMWIAVVVLASSLSLILTLIRRWRARLRAERRADADQAAQALRDKVAASGPPLGPNAVASTKTPPYELITPRGCDPGRLAWWQRVDGATTFWLVRGAGDSTDNQDASAWWVTWFAPWRRGLPERLWIGRNVPADCDGRLSLGPGLNAAWRGSAEVPSVLGDVALWQEASLCGFDIELVPTEGGVGLRVAASQVHNAFELGSLAALAALIEARAGDGVLPPTWDVAAVRLRLPLAATPVDVSAETETETETAQVWGDLPPFGGLLREDGQWRFEGRGARDDTGALLDLWPHSVGFTPLQAGDQGVLVRLDDGRPAELRALDGRHQALAERLGMQSTEGPVAPRVE